MSKNQHVYGVNALKVVVITSLEEQKKMIKFLEKNKIEIVYDSLKEDQTFHPLWAIRGNTCALIGPSTINKINDKIVIHGLNELKKQPLNEDC